MRRPATLAAPLVGVLLLAGCDVVAGATATNQLTPFEKPPQVDGASVTLVWVGSACAELRRALVEETSEEVRIELRTRQTTDACDGKAVAHTETVELDAPLGERELVDAVCLQPEFAGHDDCPADTEA